MSSLSSVLRPAWRSLRRSPAFTVTASLTLIIGIGAAVAIFALVNGVLLRPLPYGDPDRLVVPYHNMSVVGLGKGNQTQGTYFTYKKLARSLEAIGVYQSSAVNVSDPRGGGEPQRMSSAFITQSVIPLLQVPPLIGRNFTEAEDAPKGPNVAIISEGLWRSRFGADRGVLGRTIDLNGRTYEIVGVMPTRFRFPSPETQIWIPTRLDPNDPSPGGFNYDGIARLRKGITIAAANRDLVSVLPKIVELSPNLAPGVSTQMLLDQARPIPFVAPLKEDVTGGIAKTLWIVAAAAGVVLLVACANVTNLILVRADGRQRELAVREALGAGRGRVTAYFLGESLVVTVVSAAAGLALAAVAIRVLVSMGPTSIPRLAEVHIDLATVAFAIVVSALVAVACSIVPVLRIGRVHLSSALREGGRGGTAGRARQRVRSALVASQIALALVALASSGLLLRTFQRLNAVRPGFEPEGLATFWVALPYARYTSDTSAVRFYSQLLDRVRALPGVKDVAVTSRLPFEQNGGWSKDPLYPEDDLATYANKIPPLNFYTTTDGGYFRAMGIPLIAGKTFDRIELQRGDEAIISRATAIQFWKDSTGQRVLGKRFRELPGTPWLTVVGVVGDTRDSSLASPPSLVVYRPQSISNGTHSTQWTMALVVRTASEPAAITSAVQRAVRDLDPTLPLFDIRSMSEVTAASMAQLSFTIIVLGAAALVTLILGAVGLYGVMAYVVSLRTRELAVRIALGATPSAVIRMLTTQGVIVTGFGVAGGLVLFVIMARALKSLLFGVTSMDPVTLLGASLLLVGIAAFASWLPARRTARVDPADVLRAE
ncbi:MAG TPA: ABC transporter permease [Gemmatimonadaceae bacterium]|nr:ABC transporter permease [Gemmatimonadaceae bacterium]